ncbi:hypothetical protein [Sclerotinia sclerotiorum botybirnavirus 2]|uniref:Uncharacterized protein n=1 Tax=Sclerotinia sclerotiorum botybirnavirus 2 TaxID=1824837 RepID=A0A144LIM6_9VIRU|nr:hypothetical protein [Sclerotinia sclerotiorum botybirnavirus 2]
MLHDLNIMASSNTNNSAQTVFSANNITSSESKTPTTEKVHDNNLRVERGTYMRYEGVNPVNWRAQVGRTGVLTPTVKAREDGFCYLWLLNRTQWSAASGALGTYPTLIAIHKWMLANHHSYSTAKVASVAKRSTHGATIHITLDNRGERPDDCVRRWGLIDFDTRVGGIFGLNTGASALRGFKISTAMPTRLERSGARAANLGAEVEVLQEEPTTVRPSNLFAPVDIESALSGDVNAYGQVMGEGLPLKVTNMTSSLLMNIPDIAFEDEFSQQEPIVTAQALNMIWGYSMTKLPPSCKGPGYNDIYSVRTWMPHSKSSPFAGTTYPVTRGIGYNIASTRAADLAKTAATRGASVPTAKEFTAYFDKLKQWPVEFEKARDIKATPGDNHIAFLVLAKSRVLALKQAAEQGAIAKISRPGDNVTKHYLPIDNKSNPRGTTSSGIMDGLIRMMVNIVGGSGSDIILPSEAATAEELIVLGYLCGFFDDNTNWTYQGNVIDGIPYFATIKSDATGYYKIPACNAIEEISLNTLGATEVTLTVGLAEYVLNEYIKRMGIETQYTVASQILLTLGVNGTSAVGAGVLTALPCPHHAAEYDLWAHTRALRSMQIPSLIRSEKANLLAVLMQVISNMLINVVTAKLIEHLESEKVSPTTGFGPSFVDSWINERLGGSQANPWYNWVQTIIPGASPELYNLLNGDRMVVNRAIAMTMMSGFVQPSSMLFLGEKIETGTLGLIWDEKTRRNQIARSHATVKNAKMLAYLYSGEENIFDTVGPSWLFMMGPATSKVVERKYDVATGLRSERRVVGTPRMVHIGLYRSSKTHNERFSDVVNAPEMAEHYEPVFDLTSAAFEVQGKAPLRYFPTDIEQHKEEKHEAAPNRDVSYKDALLAGIKSIAPEHMKDVFRTGYKAVAPPKGAIKHQPGTRTFQRQMKAKYHSTVVKTVTNPRLNAEDNGISQMLAEQEANTRERIRKAHEAMDFPEEFKGTEFVELTEDEANGNAWKTYVQSPVKGVEIILNKSDNTKLEEDFEETDVPGDGRCGMSALHKSLELMGIPIGKKELFEMEAEILQLKGKKAPKTLWVSDVTIAMVADKLDYDTVFVFREGGNGDTYTSLKTFTNEDAPPRQVVPIAGEVGHWLGGKFTGELEDMSANELADFFTDRPSETRGGSADDVEAHNTLTKKQRKAAKKSKIARIELEEEQFLQLAIETAERERSAYEEIRRASTLALRRDICDGDNTLSFSSNHPSRLETPLSRNMNKALRARLVEKKYQFGAGEDRVTKKTFNRLPFTLIGQDKTKYQMGGVMHDLANDVLGPNGGQRLKIALESEFGWSPGNVNHLLSQSPTAELVRYMCLQFDIASVHATCKRQDREYWYTLTETLTLNNPATPHDHVYAWFLQVGDILMYSTKPEYGGVDGFENSLHDSKYINHSALVFDEANKHQLHYGKKDREQWDSEVALKLAAIGGTKTSTAITCPIGWLTMFGEVDRHGSSNNIERLTTGLMAVGLPTAAAWMQFKATRWLLDNLGWVPLDPEWYTEDVLALLLLNAGVRCWIVQQGDRVTSPIVEYVSAATRLVLPDKGDQIDGVYNVTKGNLALPVFTGLERLKDYCDTHRRNGTMPQPPIEGPHYPGEDIDSDVGFMSVNQWVMLGLATFGGVVVAGVSWYRRKFIMNASHRVAHAFVRRYGRQAERQPLIDRNYLPLGQVDYNENGYVKTPFFTKLKKKFVKTSVVSRQVADASSLKTVDFTSTTVPGTEQLGVANDAISIGGSSAWDEWGVWHPLEL